MNNICSEVQQFLALCDNRFQRELEQQQKEEEEKRRKEKKEEDEKIRKEKLENDLELARIAASATQPVHTPSPSMFTPKLPQLTLPTFDGKYNEWLNFRDHFNQAVHNRTDISPAAKFSYLKANLKGTALDAVEAFSVNDSNYPLAYKRLETLFEHKRQIAFSIADRIIRSHPEVTRSPESLLDISNDVSNSLASLKAIDNSIDIGDLLMARLTVKRLDRVTRENYFKTLTGTDIPPLDGLISFLELERLAIQTTDSIIPSASKEKSGERSNATNSNKSYEPTSKKEKQPSKCCLCTEEHSTGRCPQLTSVTEKERKKIVDNKKLCINCLYDGHDLSSCRSRFLCSVCKEKHHTILHSCLIKGTPEKATSHTTNSIDSDRTIMLKPTAIVHAADHIGKPVELRALLDNCSNSSFILATAVKQLGLQPSKLPHKTSIQGLQGTEMSTVTEQVTLELSSRFDPSVKHTVSAYVIQKVGPNYPSQTLEKTDWDYLPTIALADPEFHKSRRVELLLSGKFYYDIIREKTMKGKPGQPVATESDFGFVIGGGTDSSSTSKPVCHVTDSINEQLQKFFQVEHGPFEKPLLTQEEDECERHFNATTVRLSTGTYQVQLPFKPTTTPLGDSSTQALRRFYSLENKFIRDPKLKSEYFKAIQELEQDGHMEQVPYSERILPVSECYYLPHHAVFKAASTTTKLRVVFDASAKTSRGNSLNDQLMIGPVIQQDLFSILVRWRYWRIPLTADIKKMYLYIDVHPDHRNYQRIFWRKSKEEPVMTYRLKKVTFGTSSAPYQAIRTLTKLADDHQVEFPSAAAVLKRDFYVDDCLTGANSLEEAMDLYVQLIGITSKANFTLRKWSTSCEQVLEQIPADLRETSIPLTIDKEDVTKALGLVWTPAYDEFKFKVQLSDPPSFTKRQILSDIARVFDPLGLLSPVTIRAKLIMQALWKCECGWDSRVPIDILREWESYQQDLQSIEQLRIPRCLNSNASTSYQLHGFSDASEKAFAAAVYLRVLTDDAPRVTLIASKTRVASTKGETIPRLELCGAVLLSQLMSTVKSALEIIPMDIYAWTDSTITLHWIKSPHQNWKTYVRNRVINIQSHVPALCWLHVPGLQNPADLPSRGALAGSLVDSDMWWHGPEFLRAPDVVPHPYPHPGVTTDSHTVLSQADSAVVETERKKEINSVLLTEDKPHVDINNIFLRYSNWTVLRRHVAWWVRIIHLRKHKKGKNSSPLTPEDLTYAEEEIFKVLQQQAYVKEIQALQEKKEFSKSSILALTPFLHNGVLRVGGRITKADLKYDNRHPVLLPRSHVTDLIIRHYHILNLHAGNSLLLTALQRRFWLVRGKSQVKRIINQCKTCVIFKAEQVHQLMADLPEPRVNISLPFTHTGIDYAGPVTIRKSTLRKSHRCYKAYIAVFVCFSTKAVTLELVSDLTSTAFRAALHRFVSRRLWPKTLNSDNGTTFVGASRELQEMYEFLQKKEFEVEVVKFLADHGTTWKFIPPAAPHMGGLWEAAVKSAKYHLKRVIGKSQLTYEAYDTLLKQVEACLNSRPLCAASNDPNDLTPLTPGHLLAGHPPGVIPETDIRELQVNRLDRWQHIQQMKQHFWTRWQDEYLQQLQRRTKWKHIEENIQVGDLVVVVRDDQHPPQFWPTARVVQIHPNPEDPRGLVRTVTIRTSTGTYKRPITKLVRLSKITDEEKIDEEPSA